MWELQLHCIGALRSASLRAPGVQMADSGGGIGVRELAGGVLECRAWGHLEAEHVATAQSEIEALLDTGASFAAALFDGRDNDSFEPGLPVRWVRWASARRDALARLAIVARPGPMSAVAGTIPYLLPGLKVRVFTSRDAAIDWLRRSVRCSASPRDERV
jgi:hypothetical protein